MLESVKLLSSTLNGVLPDLLPSVLDSQCFGWLAVDVKDR